MSFARRHRAAHSIAVASRKVPALTRAGHAAIATLGLFVIGCEARKHALSSPSVSCALATGASHDCIIDPIPHPSAGAAGLRLRLVDGEIEGDTATGIRLFVSRTAAADVPRWTALPTFYGNNEWTGCALVVDNANHPRIDHVAVFDANDDGAADIAVVGACLSGIGPDGAQPFPVGSIYLQTSTGGFAENPQADSAFATALPARCAAEDCDIVTAARRTLAR